MNLSKTKRLPKSNSTSSADILETSSSRRPVEGIRETSSIFKDKDHLGNKIINQFLILQELGRGVHGKVKLCRDIDTGKEWAIKILDKNPRRRFQSKLSRAYRMSEGGGQNIQLEMIKREIAILKKCTHPNIVGLREVIDDPSSDKIYLILEYLPGGEVQWQDFIGGKPVHSEDSARVIFRGLVSGVQYLHHQRDIKPANLLWDAHGQIKITDFGVSVFVGRSKPQSDTNFLDSNQVELAKTAGSPAFFAPELCIVGEPDIVGTNTPAMTASSNVSLAEGTEIAFESLPRTSVTSVNRRKRQKADRLLMSTDVILEAPIGAHIDIWAMGVTLYCILFGNVPFLGRTEFELFHVICKQEVIFPENIPVSESVRDLLKKMFIKDPLLRIDMEDIKFHDWTTMDLSRTARMTWLNEQHASHQFARPVTVSEEEVKQALSITGLRKISSSFQHLYQRSKSQSFLPPSSMHHVPLAIEQRIARHTERLSHTST